YHQHVEMLVDGVPGERPGRIGGRRQHVLEARDLDDVGGVPAAGALGVKGVDGAALERLDGVLDEAGLVKRVGVDHHLYVESSATARQQSIAAGVVPQSSCSLSEQAPPSIISSSAAGREALPLPAKPRLTGNPSAAWIMRPICHGPGVHVVAKVPCAGPVPPPSIEVTPDISASSTCCGQI